MKQKIDKELAYIACRLTELIPTTSNLDEFGVMEVAKFKMKQEPQYRKVSENEIQILEEDPMEYDKGLVNSEMLLNNIQSRRYDSSKSYKKLLDNEEGGKKGEKDSGANDARKDGDDSSSDGEEDDDSTDGLIDIQYV
ncbi:unnamed protein product [Pseudo-nitzschia multistriata]|uniref:Uncharacterized protein n=1 Tax=Pseudo-nitzschia multistriata TaxID=183589 RepID=A0A448YU66_9STRA|nr:unnamed protein product [Pseudo-nitzschia multistriata]